VMVIVVDSPSVMLMYYDSSLICFLFLLLMMFITLFR